MSFSFLVYLFLGGCLTTAHSMKRRKNLLILPVSLTHTVNLFLLKKHQLNSKNYGRFRYLRLQYIWAPKLFPVACCYMDGNDGDGFINLKKKIGPRIGRRVCGHIRDALTARSLKERKEG